MPLQEVDVKENEIGPFENLMALVMLLVVMVESGFLQAWVIPSSSVVLSLVVPE